MNIFVLTQGGWAMPLLKAILESKHRLTGVAVQVPFMTTVLCRCPLFKNMHYRHRKGGLYDMLNTDKTPFYLVASANESSFIRRLQRINPDVIMVACWSEILDKDVWSIPRYGSINFHPSLLPENRGANPFVSAILSQKGYTGVTFHFINEDMDAGDIIFNEKINILDSETGGELAYRCADIAASHLPAIFDLIESRQIKPQKQDPSKATYCDDIKNHSGLIDIGKSAKEIHDYIRAIQPWIRPFFIYGRKKIFIKRANLIKNQIEDGYVAGNVIKIAIDGIYVTCKDATLLLEGFQDG